MTIIQVHISPWRYNAAYLGAQILASAATFPDSCVTPGKLGVFLTNLNSASFQIVLFSEVLGHVQTVCSSVNIEKQHCSWSERKMWCFSDSSRITLLGIVPIVRTKSERAIRTLLTDICIEIIYFHHRSIGRLKNSQYVKYYMGVEVFFHHL